jgi:hypothetical protein
MSLALPLALAALVPVMVGPLPATGTTITAKLCGGGTITIPLGDSHAPGSDGACHPKGCHAGTCREREKRRI